MTTIRSSTQSGLKIESDNSSNISFVTGQSNINLKVHASGLVEFPESSRLIVPAGNTAARPAISETGAIRLNTDTQSFEIFQGPFWSPFAGGDRLYTKTVSHITGDGEVNVNNDTYIDESTNAFTLTKFGRPEQGSYNPYQKGWSVFFDNNGDFISNVASTRFSTSSGGNYDFTIEAWVYQVGTRSIPNEGRDVIYDPRTAESSGPLLAITGRTGQLEIAANSQTNSSAINRSANVIIPNQWNHIAFVRQSNTLYYYINGVQDANTYLLDIPYTAQTPRIGGTNVTGAAEGGNASSFHGFISNFRFTRDAVYTDSFTVPSTLLTALPNTVILTCQDTFIQDNSEFKNTLTFNGEAAAVPYSPFGQSNVKYNAATNGGSVYFDGTSDYFTIPNDVNLQLGSGDFTAEGWFNPLRTKTGSVVCFYSKGVNTAGGILFGVSSDYVFCRHTSQTDLTYNSGPGSNSNKWIHVAWVRSGNTLTIYRNGVSVASATVGFNQNDTGVLYFGSISSVAAAANRYGGYISNFRIVKGTAVYTENFTPPTAPVAAIENTSLLLNFNNAGIYDSRQNNNLETIGDVKIVAPAPTHYYGNSAISFNGNSYLTMPLKSEQRFNTNPFTVESWIYRTDSNTHTIFNMGTVSQDGLKLAIVDDVLVLEQGFANASIASTVGSVRFQGKYATGDYVEYTGNIKEPSWKYGTNNYTMEYWIYPERSGVEEGHVCAWNTGGSFYIKHSSTFVITYLHQQVAGATSSSTTTTGAGALTPNTWNHVAISKQWPEDGSKTSGNLRIFVNGLLAASNPNHSTAVEFYNNLVKPLRIGIGPDRTLPFEGKIADVRITNGECLYTANFTVPNSPLTILNANTSFLSCQNGLEDAGYYQSPLFVPKLVQTKSNVLITRDSPYDANAFTTRIPTNTWVHVAAVRSSNLGNQTSLYINGTRVANGTVSVNFFNANAAILIGENELLANGFSGYIKDFRITNDARYTTDFRPPAKMPDRNS